MNTSCRVNRRNIYSSFIEAWEARRLWHDLVETYDETGLTFDEAYILLGTVWDLKLKKGTTASCPKCGNELELSEKGKFVTVSCKTKGCLSATRKGI